MTAEKLTISLERELAAEVRASAAGNVSAWLAEAAKAKLRLQALREFVQEYEAQHGEITEEELEQANAAWPA